MNRNSPGTAKLYRTKLGVKVTAVLALLAAPLPAAEVTIYRDGWGVPHIYGETDEAVAFGYGYAQAQDRLDAVLDNYARANGRLAERHGVEAVASDFQQRLWGHREAADAEIDRMPTKVRAWTVAFAAGVQAGLAENAPVEKSVVRAEDVIALGRYLFWRGIRAQLDAEYARGITEREERPVSPGTLWGLAPERSAHDAVTLVADPSEDWSAETRFYEAHLHGPDFHAWGFTYPGLPLPVFGHNRTAGYGWLPGGPDTGDVYRITFESEGSSRYSWAGRTRDARLDTFRIAVKGAPTTVLTGQRTHLGPILHRTGRTGYAYRVPAEIGAGQVAQLYGMIRARDFKSFYDAIRPGQLGPATLLYGDTSGVLFYIRSGHVPIRPESVAWDRAVTTDVDSDWIGSHVQEDLVQILDPLPGWIVDSETAPDLVTPYSPLIPDRFPAHIFNAVPGRQSARSARLRALIGTSHRMGLSEVLRLPADTHMIGSSMWLRALALAVAEEAPEWTEEERTALDILTTWDGVAEPDRFGPALYNSWRRECNALGRAIDTRSIENATTFSPQTRRSLIRAFRTAVRDHKATYGHQDVRWKEVHRARRDQRSWGVPGMNSPAGRTLRDVRPVRRNVVDYVEGGQSAPTVILFDPAGIRSFSAVPFGQSDRADSPHSWDQAEALFTQGVLKPTRFDTRPRDLTKKEVLRLPENLSKQ